jgi:hypothetical protein
MLPAHPTIQHRSAYAGTGKSRMRTLIRKRRGQFGKTDLQWDRSSRSINDAEAVE